MKTILIIEDNINYKKILAEALEGEKYTVLLAENGRVALELVQKKHVDLIILDLLMPQMDGISFYYQLQKKLKKHIPIIVLTNVTNTAAYGEDIKEVMIKANVSLSDVVSKVKEHVG